jgi:hypothetical protein
MTPGQAAFGPPAPGVMRRRTRSAAAPAAATATATDRAAGGIAASHRELATGRSRPTAGDEGGQPHGVSVTARAVHRRVGECRGAELLGGVATGPAAVLVDRHATERIGAELRRLVHSSEHRALALTSAGTPACIRLMTPPETTHERELTSPVELCTPDGRRLHRDARGWSRVPLHRANLRGRWGRNKRWDYWALLTEELAISVTYADVDYLGIVAVWWADLTTGRSGGRERAVPFGRGIELPDVAGSAALSFGSAGLDVRIEDDTDGTTRLWADWREPDGNPGHLAAAVVAPPGHESVNVVIPWSETRFQYTSKHQARPAHGELVVGDEVRSFGDDHGEAWGVLDVGRGRWPYRTRWNWGGGAGRSTAGQVVGIQVGGKWTVGTGATENGVVVDGEVVKLGEELTWAYDWDEPMAPWSVRSSDGGLDLTLQPRYDRHSKTQALVLATEVHQVFGRWSGRVPAPDGRQLEVAGLVGFAEESRSRW